MSGDYKWDIQVRAEELAFELYNKDFYDLDTETQYRVYERAMHSWSDSLADRADYLRKAERENMR